MRGLPPNVPCVKSFVHLAVNNQSIILFIFCAQTQLSFSEGTVIFVFIKWLLSHVTLPLHSQIMTSGCMKTSIWRKPQESSLNYEVMMDMFISYLSREIEYSQHSQQQTGTQKEKWDLSNCYPVIWKAIAWKVWIPLGQMMTKK